MNKPLTSDQRAAVFAFVDAVLHGDQEHRRWLLEAAGAFAKGMPMPPARGGGLAQDTARNRANCAGAANRLTAEPGENG